MGPERATNGLLRESDQSFSSSYGPFVLRTGFQPIFSQNARGGLKLEAFEALIRPFKNAEPVTPAQFFAMVQRSDATAVERLCRRLHLANMSANRDQGVLLFLNINPQHFPSYPDMLADAEALAREVLDAGLHATQVVCEIVEKEAASRGLLVALVEALREHHFKIAIDDYGADDSDLERLTLLRPDIVKFDGLWVQRFLETPEGFTLLRTMVRQFRDNGIMTLFEGLEEHWQVAACRELGVRLLQGFVLARPQLAASPRDAHALDTGGDREPAPEAHDTEQGPLNLASQIVDDGRARRSRLGNPPPARRAVFGRRGR